MRFKRWGALLLGTLVLAAMVIGGAGAVTQPRPITAPAIDLSTRASVVKYLSSLGIDSRGIVVQRGALNYAGPSCPGVRWTCTTAKRVLQINGVNNRFECTPSDDGSATSPNDCLIVQSSTGTDNSATCSEKIGDPTGTQSCRIFQVNTTGANRAQVLQQVAAGSGITQYVEQWAEIGQWNEDGSNSASVNQDLKASQSERIGGGSITLQQDGRQTAVVGQHSDTGNNSARVDQSQQLKQSASGGSSITELQNTDGSDYNVSAAIYQNSDQDCCGTPTSTGTNDADIHQKSDLNASGSKTGMLTQTQGDYDNGLFAHVDQRSTGRSTSSTNQDEHQSLGASQVPDGNLFQTQIGPLRFDPNQDSNPNNNMTVSQQSDQNAGSGAEQSNEEEASCDTSGLCTVKQMASNDKQRGTNQCGPAMTCDIGLNVQAGFGEGDGVDTCTGDPEEESSCTFPPYSPPEDPLDPGNEAGICDVLPYAPPCYYLG